MLVELVVRNFAVVKDVSVSFGEGLNAISGETGAGKSIVVGAIELLVGGRASAALVRSGEERASVEGVLDARRRDDARRLASRLGLRTDDGFLVLRREVRAEGRSRGWVNGSPVAARTLRRIGSLLVDVHGQHEHQRLLSPDYQRRTLDALGGCRDLARKVAASGRAVDALRARLARSEVRRRELESRSDFVRFQLGEIADADVRPEEAEELKREGARLRHADRLASECAALCESLRAGDDAIADRLAEAVARLRRLGETDPSLTPRADALSDVYHRLADEADELATYAEAIEHDPGRLEEIREREALLQRLARKHGPTLADVVDAGVRLRRELDELETADVDRRALEAELERAESEWTRAADALTAARRVAADALGARVDEELPSVGLDGGRFEARLEPSSGPLERGSERVRFLATMNPGFPPGPLAEIASGGELSRVMLVLKSALGDVDEAATLVFDEVDAGIGGEVAGQVGKRLAALAETRQVLVVTHLARIAALASRHIVVEKASPDGTAVASLRTLAGDEERLREIARMLGGDPDSAASREHARDLLART